MPLAEERQEILKKYGPYVRSLAAQVRKQFSGHFEMEDLMAYGQVGLLEAADRFDAKVGANFLTFAHYRIKGAIYDGLRKMGVLKGGDNRTAYYAERSNAYMGNQSDREMGTSNFTSTFDDDVREVSGAVSGLAVLLSLAPDAEGMGFAGATIPADERLELEQQMLRVREAVGKLPEKERKLLEGYYFQGKTLEEAGGEIGQSKSWASRLHARAIDRLKEILSEDDEPKDTLRRSSNGHSRIGRRQPGGPGAGQSSA